MKVPALSGKEIIRRFEKLGYEAVRQKGSHVRMIHKNDSTKKPITVPLHSEQLKLRSSFENAVHFRGLENLRFSKILRSETSNALEVRKPLVSETFGVSEVLSHFLISETRKYVSISEVQKIRASPAF